MPQQWALACVRAAVALVCVSCVYAQAHAIALPFEGLYRLDIIHYNDFHARFEETSVETPTCRFNNNSCVGGFPRLFHAITELRKEKPQALLINAGDSFQGTYWYSLLKWNVTQQFMNLLPHDAHAIGNHEFDDGPLGLAPYLSALKAPVLAANMDVSKEPSLQSLFQPSVVVERKGRRIGLIGLITPDTEKLSSPGGVVFSDPGAALAREGRALSDRGVDLIVLVSHCGLDVDKQLAREHGEYIDIIVGSHSHSLLWTGPGPAPSGESVAGPYPVFVENTHDSKHKVLIVQASAFTKYIGNLSVYFDYKGDLVNWDGGPIFLNRSFPEDPQIKAMLEPYAKLVQEAEREPVGMSETTLHFEDCVFGECALGDVLVDSMQQYAKKVTKSEHEYLSFMQRGNIKSTLPAGTITQGMLFELLPYNDRLQVFELRGDHILEALERSVTDAWDYHPFKGPWVLQLAGIKVTYNISLPEGQRVTSAEVQSDVTSETRPLDKDKMYQVVAPAYLSDGGDGYTMFTQKQNVTVVGRDQATFVDYLQSHSPLLGKTDGRIVIHY